MAGPVIGCPWRDHELCPLGLVAGVVAILGTLGGMALLVWVLFALERRRRRRRVQGELATAGATMYLQELRRLQAPSSQDQLA